MLQSEMAVAYDRKQFPITRDEYEELVRRGVFEDAHVELLYGRIVSMSPIGGPHRYSVRHLMRLLAAIGDRANLEVQSSFAAPDESEPQPDLLITPVGDYLEAPPGRAWLIIEVADSSLARDRAKARVYAAANVPEYWIVDVVNGCVDVHRHPGADGYEAVTRHARGEVLRVPHFEDVEIPISEILPPSK